MPERSARAIEAVIRACYTADGDWTVVRDHVLSQLRRLVPVDAVFVGTVDPDTLLFSSAWADEVLRPFGADFLDNEYSGGAHDVNRFCDLAHAARPVGTLDESTHGDRAASDRWCRIMEPIGLGDELRVALRTASATWGFLCLHRETPTPFTPSDVSALERVAPHVAEAIRRTFTAFTPSPAECAVVVAQGGVVVGCSSAAAELLDALDGGPVALGDPLPLVLRGVLRRLEALERSGDGALPPAAAMVGTVEGMLVEVHATRLQIAAGPAAVALTMNRPGAASLSALRLAGFGLTPAQRRVAAQVLQGRSTREIMTSLHISQHTVQDHMKAVFDRTGVRSRRELVAALTH